MILVTFDSPLHLTSYSHSNWASCPMTNALLLNFVSFLTLVSYHSKVRNNQLSLIPWRKLNIVPWLWQLEKLYGFTHYFQILALFWRPTQCSIVITRLLVILLQIWSFTNEQNILKLIVISFMKSFKNGNLNFIPFPLMI